MRTQFVVLVVVCLIVAGAVVAAGQTPPTIPSINTSHDPFQVYGGCAQNFSGYIPKLSHVAQVGETLGNVTAIDVIDCRSFNGGGGSFKTPCPSGSPYAYCVVNHNDGLANSITIGVLKLTPANEPLGEYGGCATGAGFRPRKELLIEAGFSLRNIDNIVVIDCHGADASGETTIVPCPAGPNPYVRCLQNHDDGKGNAVLVGVVRSYGPGDPYSLYGGCYTNTHFRSKASLVTEAGKSLDEVIAIHLLGCGPGLGPQQAATVVACSDIGVVPPFPKYDYCLKTDADGSGNRPFLGVLTNQ